MHGFVPLIHASVCISVDVCVGRASSATRSSFSLGCLLGVATPMKV